MKTINRIAIIASILLIAFTSEAQFTSSGSSKNKKGKGQSQTQYTRQQDIQLLDQKARTAEKDFKSGNEAVLSQHKKEVLAIMDREIRRSGQDLSGLNKKLAYVPGGPDSQEGRDLRMDIMRMQNRYDKQKRIRGNVAGMTIEKLKNQKEAAGLKSQYSQFIDSMKKNLALYGGTTTPPSGGDKGGSSSTTTGNNPNEMYNTKSGKNVKKNQTPPESYYRYKDKKERDYYVQNQKNTALALTNTTKELEIALSQNKTNEVSKLVEALNERMQADIRNDRKTLDRLENGELKFSGLNAGLISNELRTKEDLFKRVKKVQLPAQKGQLFSLINEYNNVLKQ